MKSLARGIGLATSVARRHHRLTLLGFSICIVLFALLFCRSDKTTPAPAPLAQDVYVWQRTWSSAVKSAVHNRGSNFDEVVTLVAEVTWKNGVGKAASVKVDSETLRNLHKPIGIALRVNSFDGPKRIDPFDPAGPQTKFICDLAASSIERMRRESIDPSELQVDFDCPESKLDGYRNWVRTLKQRIAPTPLSITTLPSLISSPAFVDLVRECDSYVLQVHSMKRPPSPNQVEPLCDAAQARRWVQIASRIGVPYRIALPTYAYVAEFDARGTCVKLTAEGARVHAPAGGCTREIRADSGAIAQLVREWRDDRPAGLQALIWYRMPNDDDDFNWPWTTLASVMQGRAPGSDAQASIAPMLEQH